MPIERKKIVFLHLIEHLNEITTTYGHSTQFI